MVERVEIGPHVLYRGDCLEVLPTLERVDAVVTDPPYGIGEAARNRKSRRGWNKRDRKWVTAVDYGARDWDEATADEAVAQAVEAARWSVIFGGNFYALPPSSCWLVWDKHTSGSHADCELAWTNMPGAVRRISYLWNGFVRANQEPRGDHPTQKPVGVMRWVIGLLPKPNQTILDPFMGSGTTGVATIRCGRQFIGIERERDYFLTACRRIEAAEREPDLFAPRLAAPVQLDMLGAAT